MSEPRPDCYDFKKLQQVVSALDFLRKEAEKTGSEEIVAIIESTFQIVMQSYYMILRNMIAEEMVDSGHELH